MWFRRIFAVKWASSMLGIGALSLYIAIIDMKKKPSKN